MHLATRSLIGALVALVALVGTSPGAHAAESSGPPALDVTWKKGFTFTSADKAYKLSVGGMLFSDGAWMIPDSDLETDDLAFDDGAEIRSFRFYMAGTLYNSFVFKLQADLAGGGTSIKNAFIGVKGIPGLGTLRVGHIKEPIGFETNTAFANLPFMEFSLTSSLVPSWNTGIIFDNALGSGRLTWHGGFFRDVDKTGEGQGEGGYAGTVRLTGLPYSSGANLVHLGVAYSYRLPSADTVSYGARPESHLAPSLVGTGDIAADGVQLIGGELAMVFGSFSLQGDFVQALVSTTGGETASFHGYHGTLGFFVTGEQQAFNKAKGLFSRTSPVKSFMAGGSGAIQLVARFSQLTLDDDGAGITGGTLTEITGGINWFLNPWARVAVNVVYAMLEDTGNAVIVQSRFQMDF